MWRGRWEIDLEGTTKVLLLAQKRKELVIVFSSTSNQLHGIRVSGSHLNILATIKEACSELFSDKEIQGFDCRLSGRRGLRGCDIGKRGLLRGASEVTEE